MGAKKKIDTGVYWKIAIPQSLAEPISLLLLDPVTCKPKVGARGKLISSLLREWLSEQIKNNHLTTDAGGDITPPHTQQEPDND